jgi:hypothetical protein
MSAGASARVHDWRQTESDPRPSDTNDIAARAAASDPVEQALGGSEEEEAPESAVSSPPMEMDDPGTPGNRGIELNLVGTLEKIGSAHGSESLLDANYGIGDRIQLKYERPYLTEGVDGEGTQSGLGATEIGVKWRFVDHAGIEAAVYPQYSFDDGFTVVDAEGIAEQSPGRAVYLPLLVSKVLANVYTVAANFGYRMNVDTDDDDLDVALGVGRAVGSTGRVLAELFSERDTHFDNRQTDLRVGYAQSLYKSWLAGFASIGHSIGATEEGESALSFTFGFSFLKEPR